MAFPQNQVRQRPIFRNRARLAARRPAPPTVASSSSRACPQNLYTNHLVDPDEAEYTIVQWLGNDLLEHFIRFQIVHRS
jgi:hypothetical protein